DLSVPIDAWHMEGGERYLDADKFAERLAPQIYQIGVHYISAIVDEPMVHGLETGKPVYNIYGWWPSPEKPPVLIFSTAGFDLKPQGTETDRAIANVAVSGITGYLMDEESHGRPPKDCPNYFNPERKMSLLTGRQKFCGPCAKKLNAKHPEEFKALSAILAA